MDIKEQKYADQTQHKRHPWELARFEVVYSFIKKIIPSEKKAIVLDIGCGDTFFLETLASKNPNANYYGIDTAFTSESIKSYSEHLKNQPIQLHQNLTDLQINQKVDLVLLMDVIEHIEHDRSFLEMVLQHPMITADTHFIITVPAYQSLFCSHDVFLDHYRRYNNKSLRAAINSVGLEAVQIGYFFSSLLPIRVLQVWKEKIFPKQKKYTTGLVEWQGGDFKSNLLKNILYTDFSFSHAVQKVSGLRLPGLSNYVVCRKSAL